MNQTLIAIVLCIILSLATPAKGDDPDPQAVLTEARALTKLGRYDKALEKFVWFHENALRISPSMTGVRLSFALSYWVELGKVYPKAFETLIAIRDKDVEAFKTGKGTSALFQDIAAINGYLDEEPKTIALFKSIDAENPKLARQCYFFVESTLAEAREYQLCGKYIPDASQRFRSTISNFQILKKLEDSQPGIPAIASSRFVEDTQRMIQILIGAGRKADAETIQKQAIVILDDPRIRSAVEDSEKSIKPE